MPLAAAMHNTAASTVLAKYQAFLGGSGSGFCCFFAAGRGGRRVCRQLRGRQGRQRYLNSSITSGNTMDTRMDTTACAR